MHGNARVSLIIPCYDEAEGLPHVLKKVPAVVDEVVVVDNNSEDETAAIAQRMGATVAHQPLKGYGHAYFKGFETATGDVFVTLDGDGTYPVEDIARLLDILDAEGLDFISACRFPLSEPRNMDPVSKFGNHILTLVTAMLFGYGIKDSQSGMWVFRKSGLALMRLESTGMALSEEIKIEAIRRGLKFKEVHIPYHERFGQKKIKKFQDGIRNLWFLLRLRMRK
jgi:glycosyltransferase involved in cell wall biosynthesis